MQSFFDRSPDAKWPKVGRLHNYALPPDDHVAIMASAYQDLLHTRGVSNMSRQPAPWLHMTVERLDYYRDELLVKQRAETLRVQPANFCWFVDPAKALCLKLAGTPNATAPLAGLCDAARRPQATIHAHHREVWAATARSTQVFLGSPRVPPGEKARLNPGCQGWVRPAVLKV